MRPAAKQPLAVQAPLAQALDDAHAATHADVGKPYARRLLATDPGHWDKQLLQSLVTLLVDGDAPDIQWDRDHAGRPVKPGGPRQTALNRLRNWTDPGSGNHTMLSKETRCEAALAYSPDLEVLVRALVQLAVGIEEQNSNGHCAPFGRDETGAPAYWNYHVAAVAGAAITAQKVLDRYPKKAKVAAAAKRVLTAALDWLGRERALAERCTDRWGRAIVPGKRGVPLHLAHTPQERQPPGTTWTGPAIWSPMRGAVRDLLAGKPPSAPQRLWTSCNRGGVVQYIGAWLVRWAKEQGYIGTVPTRAPVLRGELSTSGLAPVRSASFNRFKQGSPGDWTIWAIRSDDGGDPIGYYQFSAGTESPATAARWAA